MSISTNGSGSVVPGTANSMSAGVPRPCGAPGQFGRGLEERGQRVGHPQRGYGVGGRLVTGGLRAKGVPAGHFDAMQNFYRDAAKRHLLVVLW